MKQPNCPYLQTLPETCSVFFYKQYIFINIFSFLITIEFISRTYKPHTPEQKNLINSGIPLFNECMCSHHLEAIGYLHELPPFPCVNLVTLKAFRIVQTLKYSLLLQYLGNLLLREHYSTMRFHQTGGTGRPRLKSFKEFAMVLLLLTLVGASTYLVLFSFTIKLTCFYRDFIKVISSFSISIFPLILRIYNYNYAMQFQITIQLKNGEDIY